MQDALLVILAAMTPLGELRASVPLGILHFELDWPLVYVLSVLGNVLPVPPLLWGLRTVGSRLERSGTVVGRGLRWRTARVEAQWGERVRRHGPWVVALIVAIPLPLTGAWTGALAVWALRVPVRKGLAAIGAGVLVAGVVVTALTLAGVGLVKLL
ncbi:MAG: small multi-drug export protein [Chloroflexota bacterium]